MLLRFRPQSQQSDIALAAQSVGLRCKVFDTPVALMRGILGSLTQVVLAGISTNQNRA